MAENDQDVTPITGEPPTGETTETSWRDALPEEIRDNENFLKYSSLESMAKGHLNAVSMLGKPTEITVPENEDERAAFYNKLGRPEEVSGYQLPELDGVPGSLKEFVDGRVTSFRETSHKLGLSSDQATGLYEWFVQGNIDDTKARETARVEAVEQADAQLRTDWGDMYDPNMAAAKVAIREFVGEEFAIMLEDTGLGNNPHLVKAFYNIGKGMMGDKFFEQSGANEKDPTQLDDEINKIMANPAYWDADSPERPSLVKRMTEIMERKHPDAA